MPVSSKSNKFLTRDVNSLQGQMKVIHGIKSFPTDTSVYLLPEYSGNYLRFGADLSINCIKNRNRIMRTFTAGIVQQSY